MFSGRIRPAESLFYYVQGVELAENFQNTAFVPNLDPVTLDSFTDPSQRANAEATCGTEENSGQRTCMIDYLETGNQALALNTRMTESTNEATKLVLGIYISSIR